MNQWFSPSHLWYPSFPQVHSGSFVFVVVVVFGVVVVVSFLVIFGVVVVVIGVVFGLEGVLLKFYL